MNREIAWFFLRNRKCSLCKERFINEEIAKSLKFGHRIHKPISVIVTVHHKDENRDHNEDKNLQWVHRSCHKGHHLNDNRKKVKSWACFVFKSTRKKAKPFWKIVRASTANRARNIVRDKGLVLVEPPVRQRK